MLRGLAHVLILIPVQFAGLAIAVFNPTQEAIRTNITMPMYYAGLASGSTVTVSLEAVSTGTGGGNTHTIGREGGGLYDISVPVQMPAASYAVLRIDSKAA